MSQRPPSAQSAPQPNAIQFTSADFVISAGSVLFRKAGIAPNRRMEVCILHQRQKDKWVLPKGRKDLGEDIQATALRETYEETGYMCELVPCRMPTRATTPGLVGTDVPPERVRVLDGVTEPLAITMRRFRKRNGVKIIWWYVTSVKDGASDKVEGTQMANECYDSMFVTVQEALERLTLATDRDVVAQALDVIQDGENAWGKL